MIELGRQARPSLYRLCEADPATAGRRRSCASARRSGWARRAAARAGPDRGSRGSVERMARGEPPPEAVAVALLHSYAQPRARAAAGRADRRADAGDARVAVDELVGTFREYERAATTEVDAALSPLLGATSARSRQECTRDGPAARRRSCGPRAVLSSAQRAGAHAALTVLSGPAGGVGGAAAAGKAAGEREACCASTWAGRRAMCALIAGGEVAETAAAGGGGQSRWRCRRWTSTRSGAGGGSIAWRDAGGALRVGPASAGAQPGPGVLWQGRERADGDGREPAARAACCEDTPLAGGHASSTARRRSGRWQPSQPSWT